MRNLIVLIIIMLLTACSSDDATPTNFGVLNPQTPQGLDLTITDANGNESTIKSDNVFGWDKGQLLEGNYWRQLRSSSGNDQMYIKFSVPKSVAVEEAIQGDHGLRPNRLRLENTGSLGSVQAELWLTSFNDPKEFNVLNNAIGSIVANVGQNNYDIIIEIDATITTQNGESVKIKGSIWKDNAE